MENNELFLNNEALENGFEGLTDELTADMTLDSVNPWMLIAVYNTAKVA